ncbi:MAG: diacylglycerol kinase family protein [Capsulimonadales bacterium]|nr:diacylglycerol kinase family protein [Capsulimonadales bacterium]
MNPLTETGRDTIPIILNARAGATHASVGRDHLRKMAREIGFIADVQETYSAEQMRETVRRFVRAGIPRIGIAGGDGTIRAAVQELAHSETALGILPQGTFNNFATALRLPQNLPAALKTLYRGCVCPVDLGRIGELYFTESAGIGLFADGLAFLGEEHQKNLFRAFATAIRLATRMRVARVRLTIDGETEELPMVLCEVANTYRIGAGLPIAPDAEVSDGHFNLVVIGDIKRRELMEYMNAVRAQLHPDLPGVRMLKAARSVRIETRRPRNVHCDDTVLGVTPVTVSMEAGALKVLVDETR